MATEYISRDSIIKWIDDSMEQCGSRYTAEQENMMEMFRTVVNDCLPFADVVERELYQRALSDVVRLSVERPERKTGKWIRTSYKSGFGYKCSECDSIYNKRKNRLNFCPNCGADMRQDPLAEKPCDDCSQDKCTIAETGSCDEARMVSDDV